MDRLGGKRGRGKRLVSLLLTLTLCVQFLPEPALAYIAEQTGNLTLTGKDGSQITTDESWEETFPYGTFAFQNSELKIKEGGDPGYRCFGRRAVGHPLL